MSAPTPNIDLRPDHWDIVRDALRRHVPDREVLAFGSRATWTAADYSDLDLAVMGEEPLPLRTSAALEEELSESDLPFRVDVVDWARTAEGFRGIIRRSGVTVQSPVERNWLYHPTFPTQWRPRPLYSMATWINGLAFRKIQFSNDGLPVIKIAEIKGGIGPQTKFTEQMFDASVSIRSGDLLFAWSGQPETSIDAFRWIGPEGWLNQHIFKVTPVAELDHAFFFYLLRYLKPHFVGIARNKQTTGLGHVTKRDLENIEAAHPPLPEQRAIAHVLGTLDDKIELNRRMNETLEHTVRAMFKSWFVDFDPVCAKMKGRDTGLPQEMADLFPSRLVDSEMGEVPDGWEVASLGDIAVQRRRGLDPGEVGADTPYIGLQHMPRRSIALADWGRGCDVSSRKSAFNAGDILFGKLRPYFHKVGIAPVAGICSTDIVVLQAAQARWSSFVLACVSSPSFVAYADQRSTGTKMPRTSWQAMEAYELCLPTGGVAAGFQQIASPMLACIVANIHESRTLATLRDTLLPKLLSGEIRVPDAEKAVEAAT